MLLFATLKISLPPPLFRTFLLITIWPDSRLNRRYRDGPVATKLCRDFEDPAPAALSSCYLRSNLTQPPSSLMQCFAAFARVPQVERVVNETPPKEGLMVVSETPPK